MTFSEKLAKRTFPTRDVKLCLDAGLVAERDAVMAQIRQTQGPDARVRSGAGVLQKRAAELEEQMRESLITIRVTGLPYALYNKIMRNHPPRKGKAEAFNPESFYSDLVYKSSSLVEGETLQPLTEVPRAEWDQLIESLTDGEFDILAGAALEVNRERGRQIGFFETDSGTTPTSSETSESPDPSE